MTHAYSDKLASHSRIFFSLFLVFILIPMSTTAAPATDLKADSVLIKKSERKLYLMKNHEVIRSYSVALGQNPVGDKQHEGDSRTPEGRYVLDYRNPHSKFYLSLRVSYPNEEDVIQARRLGMPPGGQIMIHGMPNYYVRKDLEARGQDWTEGCIAVRDHEIDEIWSMVADNTPIEILP